ncbi:MAG: murein L,D-transpeptidase catalytic domain family protein [Rudaea sp.]|nr:murein L,D-transpeptidase catalytic domain family protein [Rudaea sp.]
MQLGSDLASAAPHADPNVIALATKALACANQSELVRNTRTLSVIDYSRPSTQRRLWVFDLAQRRLLFEELVAHGRNTGDDTAVRFSNTPSSLMSSIGVFLTGNAYIGHNGYSLQLRGLDPGFNDNAFDRAIVMHGAPYVDAALAISQGRIGRSFGCPAVRPAIARALIDTIRDGSLIVAYYPDQTWLRNSAFIRDCGETAAHAATFAKTIIAMTSRPAPSRTKLSFP